MHYVQKKITSFYHGSQDITEFEWKCWRYNFPDFC